MKTMFVYKMDKALVVACTVLIHCYHLVHGSEHYTSCNNEQATNCKNAALGGSMTSLAQGGQCEAKSYVAFTHTCTITAHYQPDMDYCCCALHQRVMCCRYYQSGNLFRCVETDDTVTTLASAGLPLPLELLLPVILVPIMLIACCVICCIRCCLRHKEDGDVFCRCTGEDDDCALTKQVQLPVYMPCSGGGGPEQHSLLSSLPPPAPHRTACSHSTSFGHVHDRNQWSTGSLRYSMPTSSLDPSRGGPCHQAQACAGCHCLAATTPYRDMVAPAPCPRHRPAMGCGNCCHGGGNLTACGRQWSLGGEASDVGGGVAPPGDWANCVCACAGQALTCQSSVSSGTSDQCAVHHHGGGGQQHAADSSACVKMPLLSPNSSCGGGVGLVVLPSAPPALTIDDNGDPALGPPLGVIYATSPPSYDESVRMDAALTIPSLTTPTKPSLS